MPLIISVEKEDLDIVPAWFDLLKQVGEEMLRQEGAANSEVSVLLVDDVSIQDLNRKWRGIDAPTDVLSFAMREGEDVLPLKEDQPELLGDVIISVPRAKLQAAEYGHSIERELAFLLTHGILHLLGYDHQTLSEEEQMRLRQEKVLTACGLGRLKRGG
ncbi:MAG: rRNA maturation RNase YbeY [Firmicutes bacterium]|jgi:probable rRNA maturation factor|nr:rRNA maturation RNase YbeY [Bacillota bacterium]